MLSTINLSHKLNTFHIILLWIYQLAISKVFWQCNLYILFTHLLTLRLSIVLVFLFFFFYILFQLSLKIEGD